MMTINTNRLNNLYFFIFAALIEEAYDSKRKVELGGLNEPFDLFFPSGLEIFDNWFAPTYVVIEDRPSKAFLKMSHLLKNRNVVVVSQQERNYINYYGIRVFGIDFINFLKQKHHIAYISQILCNKKSTLETRDRSVNDNEEYRDLFKRVEMVKLSSDDGEEIIIREDTLPLISSLNEKLVNTIIDTEKEKGGLALILGNGVSIPFGSDSWGDMITNIIDYLKPYHIDNGDRVVRFLSNSSYAISSFVKSTLVRDKMLQKYYDALYYCLYRKYNPLMHSENSMIRAIALAKGKYSFLPIFTYNYDTFVEQQFSKEYSRTTGKKLGCYSGNSYSLYLHDYIIHLHGYYSYMRKLKKDIILTDKEYFDNYLSYPEAWSKKAQKDVLKNYRCLFVGSSMSDLFQMSLIQQTKDSDRKGKWFCFALMCFDGLSINERIQITKYYAEKGILLITTETFKEMPNVLANLLKVNF